MNKKTALLFLLLCFQPVAYCDDGFYEVTAQQVQSDSCTLQEGGGGAAGKLTFLFKALDGQLGRIVFNGLFYNGEKYSALINDIQLTKVVNFGKDSYAFEGIDDSIHGGTVRGTFNGMNDFEINGYFSKKYKAADCIYYRINPVKSQWAKRIIDKNRNFEFA